MTRRRSAKDAEKKVRVRLQTAMARSELRHETTQRKPAAGVTSMAVKTVDPDLREMIDRAAAKKP